MKMITETKLFQYHGFFKHGGIGGGGGGSSEPPMDPLLTVYWICWRPLPQAYQLTTSLRFSQQAASSASVEIFMSRSRSQRYDFLFSTFSRRTAASSPVQFSFFVFKFVDILCVLLYTSIISFHVISTWCFVAICGHWNNG